MKRMLTLAIAVIGLSAVGFAQESELVSPQPVKPHVLPNLPVVLPNSGTGQGEFNAASGADETAFEWYCRHFSRQGDDGQGGTVDSNVANLYLPLDLGGVEIRGIGQMFAPCVMYDWFKDLRNDTTNTVWTQAYYDQFKDAKAFTIEAMQSYTFRNPYGSSPTNSGRFVVLGTPAQANMKTILNAANYKQNGFSAGRSSSGLVVKADVELTPEALDTTLSPDGTRIQPTTLVFDPPLFFEANSAALILYVNDNAPVITQPIGGETDTREFQIVRSFWEYRTGTTFGFPNYKSMGLVMFRTGTADSILSIWSGLVFGTAPNQIRAVQDMLMTIAGTVEITSGLSYHFGREASSQGLGEVTPNPVIANSRLPFSITEIADVTIDLFDVNGQLVKNLVTAHHYIPGNYTVDLNADQLKNGTYIVRMSANGKPYSMKFNIAR